MHFDQFAGDYRNILDQNVAVSGEDSSYFAEYKARYLARMLPKNFQGKVLDFGCGVGLLSKALKKHLSCARVDGFDVSSESLQQVDENISRLGTFTNDPSKLARDYDLIVVANVLHHIAPIERRDTLRELARWLAGSGLLAVFEHNPFNPLTRRAVRQCAFDRDAVLLGMREAARYFGEAGLRVTRRDYIVFMPRLLKWLRPLEPCLAGVPLGAQYVVIGETSKPIAARSAMEVDVTGGRG